MIFYQLVEPEFSGAAHFCDCSKQGRGRQTGPLKVTRISGHVSGSLRATDHSVYEICPVTACNDYRSADFFADDLKRFSQRCQVDDLSSVRDVREAACRGCVAGGQFGECEVLAQIHCHFLRLHTQPGNGPRRERGVPCQGGWCGPQPRAIALGEDTAPFTGQGGSAPSNLCVSVGAQRQLDILSTSDTGQCPVLP